MSYDFSLSPVREKQVSLFIFQDGKSLMEVIQRMDRPLEITRRRISVSYQREPGQQSNNAANAAIAAAQWSSTTEEAPVPDTSKPQESRLWTIVCLKRNNFIS